MRKWTFIFSVFAGVLVGAALGVVKLKLRHTDTEPPPNIVVLSFCSLRKAEITEDLTPNLQKILKKSYIFPNAFSRYGWTNASFYMFETIPPQFFKHHGYDLLGTEASGLLFRIPSDMVIVGSQQVGPDQFVNNYKMPLAYLRSLFNLPHMNPFFAYVHTKYMHYPYIDTVNPESRWAQFLTPAEKKRVDLALSGKAEGSLPLKLVLTGDPKYVGGKTPTRVGFNDLYPYFSDPDVMTAWQKEATYAADLEIIRKVYRAKLRDWDRNFADLFDLFKNPDIRDNTIVIVTGDHGEAMMEHGTLGHANETYDEVITFPLAIHFPGQEKAEIIDSQFFQGSMVDLVRGLVSGKVTAQNFKSTIPTLDKNKMIISRNCADTSHSVREENRWKYMQRGANDPELFDLQADPKETKNVIAEHQDVATRLKFYLIDHANEFAQVVDVSPCKD